MFGSWGFRRKVLVWECLGLRFRVFVGIRVLGNRIREDLRAFRVQGCASFLITVLRKPGKEYAIVGISMGKSKSLS